MAMTTRWAWPTSAATGNAATALRRAQPQPQQQREHVHAGLLPRHGAVDLPGLAQLRFDAQRGVERRGRALHHHRHAPAAEAPELAFTEREQVDAVEHRSSQLGEVLNRVDVVVRRRRDEADARRS